MNQLTSDSVLLILHPGDEIAQIKEFLNEVPEESIVLVSSEEVTPNTDEDLKTSFTKANTDILFASSAAFEFSNKALRYYYWKYYPRLQQTYNFLNPKHFVGTASSISKMIVDLEGYDQELFSFDDLLHRLFVDRFLKFIEKGYSLKLDSKQSFFGNSEGRSSISKWPLFSYIHSFLFFQYEKEQLTISSSKKTSLKTFDLVKKEGKWVNKKTQSIPLLIPASLNLSPVNASFRDRITSFRAYLRATKDSIKTLLHNKGEYRNYKIFRYAKNEGKDVSKGIEKLIALLRNKTAFCFSHFNDGELTFISKHQQGDHKEVWFGRRQNQYTEKLGKLLVDSFLLRKEHYYVGIPCGISHPKLRNLATTLRPVDEHTIAAMTLHHNIDRYPEILGLIKNRPLYFVVNPYQDLTFFQSLGLKVIQENLIIVPFKNSHKLYDELKNKQFEKDAVVLMMCGMLGKVLTPVWFKNSPNTTFITFGSSFDDYIQQNINFKLVPKAAPFARHIVGTRSFLFGAKPHCEDCFNLQDPSKSA